MENDSIRLTVSRVHWMNDLDIDKIKYMYVCMRTVENTIANVKTERKKMLKMVNFHSVGI